MIIASGFAPNTSLRRHLPAFDAFITAFSPLIALRYTAASGNPANFGSLAGLSITATGITYGGAGVGKLGAPSFTYALSTSKVAISNNAGFASLQAFTYITIGVLSALTAAGTRIWDFADAANHNFTIAATGDLQATIQRATTDATYVGAAGDIAASPLPRMFALSFDAAAGEALKVFQAIGGRWIKYTPVTQGSGAANTMSSNLNFGNNQSNIRAWGGQRARDVLIGSAMSEDNLQLAALSAGVIG